jgi:hypothetical protein
MSPRIGQFRTLISQGNRSQLLIEQCGKLIDGHRIQCGASGEKLRKRLGGEPGLIGQISVSDPAFENSASQLSAHGWPLPGGSPQVIFHLRGLSPQFRQGWGRDVYLSTSLV